MTPKGLYIELEALGAVKEDHNEDEARPVLYDPYLPDQLLYQHSAPVTHVSNSRYKWQRQFRTQRRIDDGWKQASYTMLSLRNSLRTDVDASKHTKGSTKPRTYPDGNSLNYTKSKTSNP